MHRIEIIDDFLNHDEITELNKILLKKTYKYGHNSGNREAITIPFFASYNEDDFFIHIKNKIEDTFKQKYKINRHYMHIQTFGQDGSFHIDDTGDNKFTFCLYFSNEIDLDKNGGDFLIKYDKIIYSIDTKFNRGILFPSQYLHKGLAYNSCSFMPRLCITWKLEIV